MADILQTMFSTFTLSWTNISVVWFKFRWNFTPEDPIKKKSWLARVMAWFRADTNSLSHQSWTSWLPLAYCPSSHDDVIKWKHFPRYWPFVRGIHRSPVNSPHKGQWRGALMFSFICVWINSWENNREAGDLRRYRAHYYVIVMIFTINTTWQLRSLSSLLLSVVGPVKN